MCTGHTNASKRIKLSLFADYFQYHYQDEITKKCGVDLMEGAETILKHL
jgi:hypothetical protein